MEDEALVWFADVLLDLVAEFPSLIAALLALVGASKFGVRGRGRTRGSQLVGCCSGFSRGFCYPSIER